MQLNKQRCDGRFAEHCQGLGCCFTALPPHALKPRDTVLGHHRNKLRNVGEVVRG
jgi:hypothetical protein